jgi:hypothetical protein
MRRELGFEFTSRPPPVQGISALKVALAIVLAHMMATLPPFGVMFTNDHVSCSTLNGIVSTCIATRATSFSGV